jgi:hypothetical protein
MHNKTWKKEKDLLSEAYASISETTHENDAPALGRDEERQSDGSVKNIKTGETVYTPKDKSQADEGIATDLANADRPAGDDHLEMEPGEVPEDIMGHEPDEVDAEIDSLKNLILNPSKDKVEEYARNGQLHVYVDMLKKKLEAAEAVKAAVRGEQD